MPHPLSRLIFENTSFSAKELDTIITSYLRQRAEWLKGQLAFSMPLSELHNTLRVAFELSEKCEHTYSKINGFCHICNPKPSLPSINWNNMQGTLPQVQTGEIVRVLNLIIDYLHSKEAREGER